METKETQALTDAELVEDLNLILKVINAGVPVLASELSRALRQVYGECLELKQQVAALQEQLVNVKAAQASTETEHKKK